MINTQNQHGIMHKKHQVIKDLLVFIKEKENAQVLDIGSAYGVASLPALSLGANVTACDISQTHLDTIKKETTHQDKLTLVHARFPDCCFSNNTFDAIILSHVLPFLSGEEITTGFKKLYSWLKPGGRCFMLSYSIYNQLMQNYIPVYEKRTRDNDLWPGELTDASLYWKDDNPLAQLLPKQLNHLSPEIIKREALNANFDIIKNDWFSCDETMPECVLLDGKEAVASILEKPQGS